MASSVRPRGYHNTSLLLPDGRILLAGSGRLDGSLMVERDDRRDLLAAVPAQGPAPDDHLRARRDGVRRHDRRRHARTPRDIAKVSLVRIGSVTHDFNMDQRWQQLSFRKVGGGLEIDAPTSPNIAPPGVYYVFLLDDNGVPSKAAILQHLLRRRADTAAPVGPVPGPDGDRRRRRA